jgi:AGCS family alanine or glycine:cation symporter
MGLFSMATKFAEVTLSLMYRKVDADGKIEGGPIQYLHEGLKELGYARAGAFSPPYSPFSASAGRLVAATCSNRTRR